MTESPYLSIIIPAYNERSRIGTTLQSLSDYLRSKKFSTEVIVVDDGSVDGTADFVQTFSDKLRNLVVVRNESNRGKGFSTKRGMLMAKGELCLFMDADNSVRIDNLERFLEFIPKQADLIIASIALPGSRIEENNQWFRRLLGRISKFLIRIVAVPEVFDTQRGFKLFTRKAVQEIFRLQTIDRWAFDIEVLVIAKLKGFRIKELAVEWVNPEGSSVRLSSYFHSLWELIKIRRNLFFGVYDLKTRPVGNIFRNHLWGIVFALLVGLVTVLPQLIFIGSLGDKYQGLYMMKADAEPYYLARIHQAYKGEIGTNPFISEYNKIVPPATLSLAESVLAIPGMVLGLSVPTLALVYKFLWPFLTCLLVYVLFWRITKSRSWSVVASVAVLLGHSLLYTTDLPHLLSLDTTYPGFWGFTVQARPVNPQFSSFFFFLYLNVFLVAVREMKFKWYFYLAIILGWSFYVYLYLSTFILAFGLVTAVIYLLRRNLKVFFCVSSSIVGGLVVGGYFFYNLSKVLNHPYYQDFATAQKLILSHRPILSLAGCLVLAAFLIYFFGRGRLFRVEKTETDFFWLGLLLTAFVVINQQVITGHLLQEGHYHWYFNVPIFILVICYLASVLLSRFDKIRAVIQAFIIAVSFGSAGLIGWSSYSYWHDQVSVDQRYMPLMHWLESGTSPGSVVFANPAISSLIPIYTFDDVVWDEMATNYLLPKQRLSFRPDLILVSGLEKNLKNHRIDYLVWDQKTDRDWHLNKYRFLDKVYTTGDIEVFIPKLSK